MASTHTDPSYIQLRSCSCWHLITRWYEKGLVLYLSLNKTSLSKWIIKVLRTTIFLSGPRWLSCQILAGEYLLTYFIYKCTYRMAEKVGVISIINQPSFSIVFKYFPSFSAGLFYAILSIIAQHIINLIFIVCLKNPLRRPWNSGFMDMPTKA